MYQFKRDEASQLSLYVGLWSTWWLNDQNRAAKFVFATVRQATTSPPPPLQCTLADLDGWIVLQLQIVDEDSPLWTPLQQSLASEFAEQQATMEHGALPKAARRQLVYDPSSANTTVRPLADPARLAPIEVVLLDSTNVATASPHPLVNRRRVEYFVPKAPGVRVFVEKPTAKQPIVSQMQADSGLAREGTLLGAANEWRTWFVLDR